MTNRFTALLFGANFAVGLGYGAILPLLPTLLAHTAGADAAATGMHTGGLTGMYMAGLFAGALAWGCAGDRLGARATLVVGLVGYAVTLVLVAIPDGGLVSAYVLRALAGFFAGAVVPVVGALAAADADAERRARVFAATAAATLLGLVAGPALTGGVVTLMQRMAGADPMPPMTLLWSLGATAAVAIGVAVVAARAPGLAFGPAAFSVELPAERSTRSRAVAMLAANFVVLFGLGAFETLLPVVGQRALQLGPAALALMFVQCSAVMLVVQFVLFFTRLLAWAPARVLIAGGFVVMAAAAAGLAAARTEAGVFAASGLLAMSAGWLLPAISYHATADAKRSAAMLLGALSAAGILGQAIGSVAGGWMYDRIASGSFWFVAGVLAMFAAAATRRTFDAPAPARAEANAGAASSPQVGLRNRSH